MRALLFQVRLGFVHFTNKSNPAQILNGPKVYIQAPTPRPIQFKDKRSDPQTFLWTHEKVEGSLTLLVGIEHIQTANIAYGPSPEDILTVI